MTVVLLTYDWKKDGDEPLQSKADKLPIDLNLAQLDRFKQFQPHCRALEHAIVLALLSAEIDIKIINWKEYQPQNGHVLLFREVWDYHEHSSDFIQFLEKVNEMGLKCLNPVKTMKWNMDKLYLRNLELNGVKIPQSMFIDKIMTQQEIRDSMKLLDQELVLKPTVSAGSFQTYRFQPNDPTFDSKLLAILAHSSVIAQPFMKEIQIEGEYSLYFFGGVFSHSIIKNPKAGHWFVQMPYGGTSSSCQVSSGTIDTALAILKTASQLIDPTKSIKENFPIARVDGILRDGEFLCCELELIEPYLDLASCPSSFTAFATFLQDFVTK